MSETIYDRYFSDPVKTAMFLSTVCNDMDRNAIETYKYENIGFDIVYPYNFGECIVKCFGCDEIDGHYYNPFNFIDWLNKEVK